MNRTSFRGVLAVAVAALGITFAGPGRADGDQEFSDLLDEVDVGLGLSFVGIGLSGRREGVMDYPLEEGTLSIADIPSGATVRHAYLYWVVYGSNGDDVVELDGTEVIGTLIGTSAHTCWTVEHVGDPNRVYRADVKGLVSGSGDFVLTGFPSGEPDSDTQGAQLVVLYDDPASDVPRRVMVRDGAMTGSFEAGNPNDTFPLHDEGSYLDAFWHLACGDGQVGAVDGLLKFAGKTIPRVDGGMIWRASAGHYWDSITFDVSDRLDLSEPLTGRWQPDNSEGDCIVYAVSALEYTLEALPEPEPGGGGAGGQSSRGEAGGPGGGSGGNEPGEGGEPSVSAGGGPSSKPGDNQGGNGDATAGGDGNGLIDDAEARDAGGCGCRVTSTTNSAAAALFGVFALGALRARRRGRPSRN